MLYERGRQLVSSANQCYALVSIPLDILHPDLESLDGHHDVIRVVDVSYELSYAYRTVAMHDGLELGHLRQHYTVEELDSAQHHGTMTKLKYACNTNPDISYF